MARKCIDWSLHGEKILRLYRDEKLSVREVADAIEVQDGVKYPSGTLTNYLGRHGALRSKAESHKLAISKSIRICDACGEKHTPQNYNQRWCDVCSGRKKYSRRLGAHSLPAVVLENQFEKQEKGCAICKRKFETLVNTPKKKTLFIDHDHETNQFRGLLCVRCNTALSFVDNHEWLDAALAYVAQAQSDPNPIYVRQPRKHRYVRGVVLSQHHT